MYKISGQPITNLTTLQAVTTKKIKKKRKMKTNSWDMTTLPVKILTNSGNETSRENSNQDLEPMLAITMHQALIEKIETLENISSKVLESFNTLMQKLDKIEILGSTSSSTTTTAGTTTTTTGSTTTTTMVKIDEEFDYDYDVKKSIQFLNLKIEYWAIVGTLLVGLITITIIIYCCCKKRNVGIQQLDVELQEIPGIIGNPEFIPPIQPNLDMTAEVPSTTVATGTAAPEMSFEAKMAQIEENNEKIKEKIEQTNLAWADMKNRLRKQF